MKANELRIGNFLENNGARKVTGHDIEYCERNEVGFNELNKPIPLAEEWLIKFGFELEYSSNLHKVFTLPSETKISYYFWYENSIKGDDNYFQFNGAMIDCKFVHQLQNLTFALTGKELESNDQAQG